MLDKQDLQAISEIVDAKIKDEHDSMVSYMDARFKDEHNQMIAYMESAIIPQIKLIAEGHATLLEKMAPKSQLEELRDENRFMMNLIKDLYKRVEILENAQ